MIVKQGRTPRIVPFDMAGVVRTDDGVLRYSTLAPSLLATFDAAVRRHPDRECLVVPGGERLTYRQAWDRAARVAGGLRSSEVRPGDRVAIRYGNSIEWCVAFFGTLMAAAVVVPVNTRFSDSEVDSVVTDAAARVVLGPDGPLPRRCAVRHRRRRIRHAGRVDVHQRNDRIPEGGHGHPPEFSVQQ